MPERVVTVIVPGTDKSIVTVPDLATTPNVALSAGCSPIKGIFYSISGRVFGKSDVLGQSLNFVRYAANSVFFGKSVSKDRLSVLKSSESLQALLFTLC